MYCNAKEGMDDKFIIYRIFLFLQDFFLGEIFISNRHLLIMDGYGSHVILKAINNSHKFDLHMITLPSHTSHALDNL